MVEFLDTLLDDTEQYGSGEGPLAACGNADLHTDQLHMIIAFFIVVVASAGICASVNLQKLVHVRNEGPDGQPLKHFTQIPLWWVAMIANTLSELFNLAALGFAPATLVAPLACLTVLFNSLTAVFWLGEPFLRRDLLGLTTMIAGVTLVVLSSTFAPVAPVTPTYIATVVAFSPLPYAYLALIVGGLALLIFCAEKRWASRYSWVYLAEAGLAGSVSTVAARAFSSCLGPPLLGKWSYMCFPPADQYCWVPYVSLVVLIASAFWSLVLQNKAMIHFGMSEVRGGGGAIRGAQFLRRNSAAQFSEHFGATFSGGADLLLHVLGRRRRRRRLRVSGDVLPRRVAAASRRLPLYLRRLRDRLPPGEAVGQARR